MSFCQNCIGRPPVRLLRVKYLPSLAHPRRQSSFLPACRKKSRPRPFSTPSPLFEKLPCLNYYPPLHPGTYKRQVNKSKGILFGFIYLTLIGPRMQRGVNFTLGRFLQIRRDALGAGGLVRPRGASPSACALSPAPKPMPFL